MLVRPEFEPATSSSADQRSPNWANQVGFTRYLSLSPYNPFFYLNTFSNFSFLLQESLCLRCLRKIFHHVPSILTVGKRYNGPWRHYCADQSLPSFASTHYFVSFSSTRHVLILMDFCLWQCFLLLLWEESKIFLGSSTECSQLKWNQSAKREKVKDSSALPHWAVLSRCSLHCPLFVKVARKFTMMTKRPSEEKHGIKQRKLSLSFGNIMGRTMPTNWWYSFVLSGVVLGFQGCALL